LHQEFLTQGLDSMLCSTCGGTRQNPDAGSFEFRRVGPDAIYFSPEMQRRAADLVEQSDVLHGHGLYVGPNFIFGREARRQQKALVYHVHGMFEPYILRRSRWKKRLVHWFFEDANFRTVRLWRALTSKEADQIRSCGIKGPVVVVPNGIHLEEYRVPSPPPEIIETPLIPKLKKTSSWLLFLGRIHPKKGLDLLITAWARLQEKHPNWQLIIAGPDEQNHREAIRKLSTALGVQDRVLFTGPVTGAAKQTLLQSGDLFVLPSYSEGFPMGLLEALASRVPVVATRACNFSEISPAGAGWECDATVESLERALSEGLGASESERSERGQRGRELIERHYTWHKVVSALQQACAAYC
jgi:glycosyltransferase involved in cell wall biosynthesis